MKTSLSKVAVAFVLLNSSIYTSDAGFLEDDQGFTTVSQWQVEGWHWGLSKATACNSQDYSECIEVIGEAPGDFDDWGYGGAGGLDDPYDNGGDHGNGGYENGGDAGGGSNENVDKDNPEKDT